ncbi:nucleoside kinase [Bacteroides sp. OttesenSCG-928-J23]|nr:nucleoside kinase [Bacteroides sp. OttesenSCG-928-J23]
MELPVKEFIEKKYTPLEIGPINRLAEKDPTLLVQMSEEYHQRQVNAAATAICENPKFKFVLLCGPSASGKTTTAHKIKQAIRERGVGARVVSMDDFFMGKDNYPLREDGKPDFESVKAMDICHLNECYRELMETGKSNFPTYDFTSGKQLRGTHPIELGPGDILILEGIHALNPEVLADIPRENVFRLYVSVRTKFKCGDEVILIPKDIRLMRRLVRDNNFRNYPPLSTLEQWAYVLAGEKVNIDPYRDEVNMKMDNTIDYEVCVWHDMLQGLLGSERRAEYERFVEIDRIFKALTRFPKIDHELIPQDSLLREFIGDGVPKSLD